MRPPPGWQAGCHTPQVAGAERGTPASPRCPGTLARPSSRARRLVSCRARKVARVWRELGSCEHHTPMAQPVGDNQVPGAERVLGLTAMTPVLKDPGHSGHRPQTCHLLVVGRPAARMDLTLVHRACETHVRGLHAGYPASTAGVAEWAPHWHRAAGCPGRRPCDVHTDGHLATE